MRERDALIAQTMAFLQLVTGKREKAGEPPRCPVPEQLRPDAGAAEAETAAQPQSVSVARPSIVSHELKAELEARIADFRAHQERFNREREQYFSDTLARLRAKIKDAPPPGPGK
jgi:hypothetical protein